MCFAFSRGLVKQYNQELCKSSSAYFVCTAEDVRNRWDGVRRAFLNALRRRRERKGGDSGRHLPPWKLEKQMSFLLPFVSSQQTRYITDNTMDDTEALNDDNNLHMRDAGNLHDIYNNIDDNLHQASPENESEILPHLQNIENTVKVESNGIVTKTGNVTKENTVSRKRKLDEKSTHPLAPDLDDMDIFFMSMSKMTKTLPPIERLKIEKQLCNAIFDAQLRNLQKTTTPTTGSGTTYFARSPNSPGHSTHSSEQSDHDTQGDATGQDVHFKIEEVNVDYNCIFMK